MRNTSGIAFVADDTIFRGPVPWQYYAAETAGSITGGYGGKAGGKTGYLPVCVACPAIDRNDSKA